MRESSKIEKTKLPSDTYEKWLGTQTKGPGRSGSRETPAKDSYEVWLEKRVETKLRARAK